MPSNLPTEKDPAPIEGAGTVLATPAPPPSYMPLGQEEGLNWRRIFAVMVRFKWLVGAFTLLGTAGGVAVTRLLNPEYEAAATIWVEASSGGAANIGPIRSGQLLTSNAWVDLMRSYVVMDDVVRSLRLYITPKDADDSVAFPSFGIRDPFRPGRYTVEVDPTGRLFTLATDQGQVVQRGSVGDSVGTVVGFAWQPPVQVLRPGRSIEFAVTTPRDAARELSDHLDVRIDLLGNFLRLRLSGTNPRQIAATLNALTRRYVDVATQLKREKLTQLTRILDDQLRYAERNMRSAEIALENFRVHTITLPSERVTMIPGLQQTTDPVIASFFDMKVTREELRQDREAIERALAQARDSGLVADALVVINAVRNSPDLMQALTELTTRQASLRAMRNTYTEDYPPLQRLRQEVETLQQQSIPALAEALIGETANRERELDSRVQSASRELQQIPPRAIEEARLRRTVTIAENLYTTLQSRYEEARLAEASSIPDVRVLDAAVIPQRPVTNTAPRLILMAFLGSLGLAVVGAVLLDRMDRRLRYPEQVSQGMGLTILGAVPHVGGRNGPKKQDDASHVVEALRGIRLSLAHAHGAAGPLLVTISSPGSGDGKSFIASNLALAFVDNGHRTLLIDGDVRRGSLHRVLNAARKPGLTDFLTGHASREQILRSTSYRGLTLIGCGTRTREGPQLLGSAAMSQLIMGLRSSFDVILIDSPPLGAGVDPFVLGTVTGNLLMVLRNGYTDRELAEAKLDVLDRLPIRILGAVLNDVRPAGPYRYYSYYLTGYEAEDEGEEVGAGTKKLPGGKSA